ncbi:hypothetical protein QJS83_13405 [Bdellovibrio sp. 22V]|uniref:hypothetical protein n=1 Tax=Bdellovibrio sp. 22V TaxID=3044166 RepID=UPI002543693E|nr:hypothetical protein [Bdellovibrio sp. 22V]WII71460.1 hypothetical protein QJS83_13405 [Bdellovibrio sp. 22V]
MKFSKLIFVLLVLAQAQAYAGPLCLNDRYRLKWTAESLAEQLQSLQERAKAAKPLWARLQGEDLLITEDTLLVLPENPSQYPARIGKLTVRNNAQIFYAQNARLVVAEVMKSSRVQLLDVAALNLSAEIDRTRQIVSLTELKNNPEQTEPFKKCTLMSCAGVAAANGSHGGAGGNGRDAGGKIKWGIPRSTPSSEGGAGASGGAGANGRNGDNGAPGVAGLNAHKLFMQFESVDLCSGVEIVAAGGMGLAGHKGLNAQDGGQGGNGGKGGRGGGAKWDRKASRGGRGGDGGAGGNGGDGGHGGDGGKGGDGGLVVIVVKPRFLDMVKVNDNINVVVAGGKGGPGGAKGLAGKGGRGGLAGEGGNGGDGSVFSHGGSSGLAGGGGKQGQDGKDGQEGRPGVEGREGLVTKAEIYISNDVSIESFQF